MSVNILLADDHKMIREGLKQLLEMYDDIKVVGEAGDGFECLNLADKTHPDVILLDINMPNLDGLQVLNIIKTQKMDCKVIVLTILNEIEYLIKKCNYDSIRRTDIHRANTCSITKCTFGRERFDERQIKRTYKTRSGST